MSLTPGTRLGPYEIEGSLGAGGMGEVYRARDTRLDRTVALKVLPAHMSDDPDRRVRLEREARAISSLSHPHICVLYDVGRERVRPGPVGDGRRDDSAAAIGGEAAIDFLVMEYLEGETLADRLKRGALPFAQALSCAIQIAEALDHAHRQGIVHRDLKPGNVMMTTSGAARGGVPQTKLLDFGLARLEPEMRGGGTGSDVGATATGLLTEQGTILGTTQYMSPEQIHGRPADVRSDIFALGLVIHEMLTGHRAFDGPSPASVMAAILEREPPTISAVAPGVPRAIDWVVGHCLAKVPAERWQSAHDVVLELRRIAGEPATAAPAAGRRIGRIPLIANSLMALAAVGLFAWSLRPRAGDVRAPLHLTLAPGAGEAFRMIGLALAPDGKAIVYVGRRDGVDQLYVRRFDRFDSAPIAGTEGAFNPFFSPDGEWIGYFTARELKKVPMAGGVSTVVCGVPPVSRGGTWSPDDAIYFARTYDSGISRVSARGGKIESVTEPDAQRGEAAHLWPQILPGGKALLFTVRTSDIEGRTRIVVHSLETGDRHVVIDQGLGGWYAPTGHVLYAMSGSIFAVPFDLDRLRASGTPVRVVDRLFADATTGPSKVSLAQGGALAYFAGGRQRPASSLFWVDRQGGARLLASIDGQALSPSLAPDGRQIAIRILGVTQDIWLHDMERATRRRVTFDESEEWAPIWTPKGDRLTFALSRAGIAPHPFWKAADGSGTDEPLLPANGPHARFATSWSPDGKALAFTQEQFDEATRRAGSDLWILPMDGDRTPRRLTTTPFVEYGAMFSPDGKWLAFVSNESGRREVYVQSYPGPAGKRLVSTEGGVSPIWAKNGRELFYRNDSKVMAVDVTLMPAFDAGPPRVLFDGPYLRMSSPDLPTQFDVAPDGQHFVMLRHDDVDTVAFELRILVGWPDELTRKQGGGPK